ncbi:MAG: SGNH/GDSL hydrolase family protein [Candidatus Krumholzibacteriia bacterium]
MNPHIGENGIKKLRLYIFMLAITAVFVLAAGEVTLRLFSPVEYLSPRYKYSPRYGFVLFENTRMVHSVPGRYKFHYTINKQGYRGDAVELTSPPQKPTIVTLGDSYTFGMGVDDGEEYPQRLARELDGRYDVVNLGNPGWGLTQEVRRYYDFGSLFHPEIVVLQYCSNDPEDNFNNMVTRVEDGRLEFVDGDGGINWAKKYLSRSIIQRSQLYNFFRNRVYLMLKATRVKQKEREYDTRTDGDEVPMQERFYAELLGQFAAGLKRDGAALVMIAVNEQLDRHPHIKNTVLEMDRRGDLDYIEVTPWFEGVRDFNSAEGHVWGAVAHRIIAAALADSIRTTEGNRP